MELKEESRNEINSLLGKKTKRYIKEDERSQSQYSEKGSFSLETSAELSTDNLLSLEEKQDDKSKKILGFDDIKIPGFLNDCKKNHNVDKAIKNYFKIKKELGSQELTKLYLIDINRLYEIKRKNL